MQAGRLKSETWLALLKHLSGIRHLASQSGIRTQSAVSVCIVCVRDITTVSYRRRLIHDDSARGQALQPASSLCGGRHAQDNTLADLALGKHLDLCLGQGERVLQIQGVQLHACKLAETPPEVAAHAHAREPKLDYQVVSRQQA